MDYRPEFDADKFKELMLYIAKRSVDDPRFGRTKLAKILCYSDFLTYAYYGHALTGASYVRYPRGPVPEQLWDAERALQEQHDAIVFDAPYFTRSQKRLLPSREPNMSLFKREELAIVDQVIADLRDDNAKSASNRSHKELIGWQVARDCEEIPYSTIFLSDEEPTEDDIEWIREVAREHDLARTA